MSLITCPDCSANIPEGAAACTHCGRPHTLGASPAPPPSMAGSGVTSAHTEGGQSQTEFSFFPVATHKFVVLSICTFGFYELYWAYRNWQRIQAASGETLSPFWRACFATLWNFSLFGRIRDRVTHDGTTADWSPPFLATCYLLLYGLTQLPNPWWLISYATFLPLVPVQKATQQFNEQNNVNEDLNSNYSGINVAVIILGGILVSLAVFGSFLPE